MKEQKQIELQDYAKLIYKIRSLLRTLKMKNICLDDVKILNEFNKIFSEEEFRESIRIYRLNYGNQEVKEELEPLEKAINAYIDFYKENKDNLESIDNYQLMDIYLRKYKILAEIELEGLKEKSKIITELENTLENAELDFMKENQNVTDIEDELNDKKELHKEQEKVKDDYMALYDKEFEDNKELLGFKFSSLFEKFSILSEILIEDYIDNKEYFNKKFSDELLKPINEVFEPELNSDKALKFFNDIGSSRLKIRRKNVTNFYCLVHLFSEKIEDEKLRVQWVDSMLEYFGKERSTYLKKRKSEGEFMDNLKKALKEY